MESAAATFEAHRDHLEELAYRMTGRVSVAQDLVQDAYLRWRRADHGSVHSPKSYLTTVVTRLCLDELKSAWSRREEYPGPWLPEPQVEEARGPAERAEQVEAVSMALLTLLDTLSPVQRAAFLLREVFDYEYEAVAEVLGRREAHCRKIVQRARDRIQEGSPHDRASAEQKERLVEQFFEAVEKGEPEQLARTLAEDATLYSDGGEEVAYAAKRPIYGAERIERFMMAIRENASEALNVRRAFVGGGPGFMVYQGKRPQSAWSFAVSGGNIQAVYAVVNPKKLRHLTCRTEAS
jgi:RNA polymerase sigma-70 factor (ECF subfamily)